MSMSLSRAAFAAATFMALLLPTAQAHAAAAQVQPGSLSTSSCPGNIPPCFIPYSGTNPLPTSNVPSGTQDTNLTKVNGNAVDTGTGGAGTGTQRIAVSNDSQIGISQATPGTTNGVVVNSSALPTGAATSALQPTLGTAGTPSANVITVQGVNSMTPFQVGVTQGSTTSGQIGALIQGAVTTSAPTYTNGQTSPISLDNVGNVRMTCISGCGGAGGTSSANGATYDATSGAYSNTPGGAQATSSTPSLTTGKVYANYSDLSGNLLVNCASGCTSASDHTTTGTVVAVNDAVTVNSGGTGNVGIVITAVTNVTNAFEASVDGTNWVAVNAYPVGGGAAVTTTAAAGSWSIAGAGFKNVRTRVTVAGATPTATVSIDASPGSTTAVIVNNPTAANLNTTAAQGGTWNITNVSGTVSLPTGAATLAKQPALGTAGTASADVITVQGITSMTALKVDGSGVTQPVSGTVTANAGSGTFAMSAASLPLPSGASTSALQSVNQGVITAATAPASMAVGGGVYNSTPLSLTTGQSAATQVDAKGQAKSVIRDAAGNDRGANVSAGNALLVDGSATTQPVSGTVTANAGSGTMAVSAASLPLPTGAATAANQTVTQGVITAATSPASMSVGGAVYNSTQITLTNGQSGALQLDTKGQLKNEIRDAAGNDRGANVSAGNALIVDASATTQPISVASLPLPSGASTAANQTVTQAVIGAATAPASMSASGGVYNSTPLTLTNGQSSAIQLDTKGQQKNVIRDAAGNDRGANVNSSNQLSVTVDNANVSTNIAQMNGVATTMGNGVSGTGVQRVTLASDSTGQVTLTTGAATIGALTANQSVNTAQINGVTPLMGNGVTGTGSQRVTIASDNTANSNPFLVQPVPGTANGLTFTTLTAANSTNATNLKASAGTLYHIAVYNNSATLAWVSFYNNAGTPTCGTSIVYQTMIPANSTSGAGAVDDIPMGLAFSTGIAYCVTTGIAGTGSVAASAYVIGLGYK